MELQPKELLALNFKFNFMKNILSLFLILILNTSCKSQEINSKDLINKKKEVLKAFLNQNFNERDSLFLEKKIYQKKYSKKFNKKYNSIINDYKKFDSLCNNSNNINVLKENCPRAFNLKKFVSLFSQKELEYFMNTYNRSKENSIIQIDKVIPKISYHNQKLYNKESLNFQEIPSLKIDGIYFSKNNEYTLIAFSIFPLSLRDGVKYGILKNEKDIWWRYIGSITLNSRIISN